MTRWRGGGEGVTMRWCSGDLKLSPLLWTLQPEQQVGTVTGGDTDTELFLETPHIYTSCALCVSNV